MTSVPEKPTQNNLIMTSNLTPVQNKVDCSDPECTKTFVSKRNMTKHKDKFHSGDKDIGTPSTQGTSDGSVNSPKVMSDGFFQCDECTYI